MPQFRFSLAAVLNQREAARDERRRHYAQALEAERRLELQIEQLETQIRQAQTARAAVASGGRIDVEALIHGERYELLLAAQLTVTRQQKGQVAEETEQRRLALVEADREVRMLERLRERQEERFLQDMARREQREMDEIAIRRVADM